MLLLKLFTVMLLLVSLGVANENNTTKPSVEPKRHTFNVPEPTNSSNPLEKTTTDWENLSKQQGVNESITGGAQDIARKMYGPSALSPDIGQITDVYINQSSEYKDNKAITGYTADFQATILENATLSSMGAKSDIDNIRCYITRDIPFRYTCSVTGIMYGGDVAQNGAKARDLCRSECYETRTCVEVTPDNSIAKIISMMAIHGSSSGNILSRTLAVDKDRRIDRIEFTTDAKDIRAPFYVDISYIDNRDKEKNLVVGLYSMHEDEKRVFTLGDIAKSVTLRAYTKDGITASIAVTDIQIIYKSAEKWICPTLQDISNEKPENFAKLCPSGRLHTFTKGVTSYTICEDGGVLGDNTDGTFSSEVGCKATCKDSGNCTPDISVFTTDILKNFREGCILGQANCKDEYCTMARKKNDPIINEIFFDAGSTPTLSIQNSIQVRGIKRPRISVEDDMEFEKRNAEEWKDKAYETMLREKTFNLTEIPIGQNTSPLNAFGIGTISGADYGVVGTSVRTLNWKLKPASFDVSNGKTYRLYSVFTATIGRKVWNERGERVTQRERIWFVKTSNADTYKPFYREIDIGAPGITLNNMENVEGAYFSTNEYAKRDFQGFSGGAWHGLSESQMAEHFLTKRFDPEGIPFWTFPVVHHLGDVVNQLPGLMRSRTKDLFEHPVYTGPFDGSADGMLSFAVATTYSETALTYKQLLDGVLSGDIPTIYHSNAPHLYPKEIGSDANNHQSSNIQIFQYGQASKQTNYMRVFPRKNDVAKKGFIYVFIY